MDNLKEIVNKIIKSTATDDELYQAAIGFYSTPLSELLTLFDADLKPLIYKYPHIALQATYPPNGWNDDYYRDDGLLRNGFLLYEATRIVGGFIQEEIEIHYGISIIHCHSLYHEDHSPGASLKSGIRFDSTQITAKHLNHFAKYTYEELVSKEAVYVDSDFFDEECYWAYKEMCTNDGIHDLVKNEKDFYKRNLWTFTIIEHLYRLNQIFKHFSKYVRKAELCNAEQVEDSKQRYFPLDHYEFFVRERRSNKKTFATTRRDAKDNPPFQGTMSPEGDK